MMEKTTSFAANLSRVHAQAMDRSVFEELYQTYLPKVYNYVCYRVGNVDVAEDITADIFERALTRLHTYQSDRGAFAAWLFSIAHNVVANHWRASGRRPSAASIEMLPDLDTGDVSPEQATIKAEQLRLVFACIGRLPEQQQEVLALKFGWGASNQEIAKAMRLSANHVGVLIHRALSAVRQMVDKEEVLN